MSAVGVCSEKRAQTGSLKKMILGSGLLTSARETKLAECS